MRKSIGGIDNIEIGIVFVLKFYTQIKDRTNNDHVKIKKAG